MEPTSPGTIQRVYLTLLGLTTLAASFIWGINTLFLLDAGLSNTGAFAANAFFTAGMLLFEVPTGVVADLRGRRTSYLLGVATLAVSTALYLYMWQISAPFWGWAIASVLIGLGFTFFSGATEAWLVDALTATGYRGTLDRIFARGEIVEGVAMLTGSVAGGIIAQATNLGVPYLLRGLVLAVTFVLAWLLMRDIGFTPGRGRNRVAEIRSIFANSLTYGLRNPPVRWVMLTAPFTGGITIYAAYAAQPYLLELYGDEQAYVIAGSAAAVFAAAQIAGGLLVPRLSRIVRTRTAIMLAGLVLGALAVAAVGLVRNVWLAITLLVVWGLTFSAAWPVRQAYLNGLIPSERRATVLSFDSLFGSTGGVVFQPALGRAADAWGYAVTYLLSGAVQAIAVPFLLLARRERTPSDPIEEESPAEVPAAVSGAGTDSRS